MVTVNRNDISYKLGDQAGEQRLNGWGEFVQDNQMRDGNQVDWLQNELGLPFKSLSEAILEGSKNNWLVINAGFVPNTIIEAFRNTKITGSNLGEILAFEGGNMICFPLSLFKNHPLPSGVPFSQYDPQFFDAGALIGCEMDKIVADGMFAVHAQFASTSIRNGSMQKAVLNRATLRDCDVQEMNLSETCLRYATIEDCNFNHVDMANTVWRDALYTPSLPDYPYLHTRATDTSFINVMFSRSDLSMTIFERCRFVNAWFDGITMQFPQNYNAGDNVVECLFENCSFVDTELTLRTGVLNPLSRTRFQLCDFSKATFSDENVLGKLEQCVFRKATFSNIKFQNELIRCDFSQAQFDGTVSFTDADISGSVFTGSNLDSILTKDALKAQVSQYDGCTLWVDGKPL